MSAKLTSISREARELSVDEKLELAHELVADALVVSPSAHAAAWRSEVKRRRKEVAAGRVKLVPAKEVERSLDRLLKK